jgi:chromosome segregation ATPase
MAQIQQQSYSYSSSSSSGGGVGGIGIGGIGQRGGAVSSGIHGGLHNSGSPVLSSARKTNISRTIGGSGSSAGSSMLLALSALGGGTASYAGTHGLGADPSTVITNRQREQRDLQDLNVKLADYISSVGFYKAKVKEQEKIIATFKGKFESMENNLRAIYDAEMAQLRATIDATAKEKAAVELKVQTLEELYKDFRGKFEAELAAHDTTRARLPKLEREISEKDAQIDFLAKTLSSLEPQVSTLKAQISKYQRETIDAKMGADAEIVRRVELESKLVTKDEEIAFLKRIYEEKLRLALDLDMDSTDVQAIYSHELGKALCDIRAEYQAQLEAIRGGSDDSWYQSKFTAMMQTSEKQGRELLMAKEEVTQSKAKYTESMTVISTLNAQISTLQGAYADLQADLDNEKKLHVVALGDRDAQIAEYKRQIAAHILELKGLMDMKLALDTEIAEYRRLLLGE